MPGLVPYGADLQEQAAQEMEAEPRPPCHPQAPSADCSAIKTLLLDYAYLRAQLRAGGAN